MSIKHSNFSNSATKYSLGHYFGSIYSKIEFVAFVILSIIFITVAKLNQNFSTQVSFLFIKASSPIVSIVSFPFNATTSLITNFEELILAKNNNQTLQEENNRLRSLYLGAINAAEENKELKNMLKFVAPISSSYQIAKVISRAHEIFNQNLLIELTKDSNIKIGNIVIGNIGVIGRIIEAYDNKSRVMLVTDANSRIPIITSNARVRGILAGNNSSLMKILYLPKDHLIKTGDLVFTAADGDTLPPGLLIGIVKKVDDNEVEVEAAEDADRLNFVTIVNY